jgi:hypothetical protein
VEVLFSWELRVSVVSLGEGGGVTTRQEGLGATSPAVFISQRAAFRSDELVAWYRESGRGDAKQAHRLLEYHVRAGRLHQVKRGVYSNAHRFDPIVIASCLAPDAIIAYASALALHGLTDEDNRVCFLTDSRATSLLFSETLFQPVRVRHHHADMVTLGREGTDVAVTSLVQTFVDCAERLEFAPPLHLLVRAFAQAKKLDLEAVADCARQRGSPLLMSRLAFCIIAAGHYLSGRALGLFVGLGLQRPDYFERRSRGPRNRVIPKLKLVVSPEQYTMFMRADGAATFHEYAQPRGKQDFHVFEEGTRTRRTRPSSLEAEFPGHQALAPRSSVDQAEPTDPRHPPPSRPDVGPGLSTPPDSAK